MQPVGDKHNANTFDSGETEVSDSFENREYDESILRKKRPERDSSGQSPAVGPVLRNVTNRGDSNETSEMRNSAPEFLLRAQRVRQSTGLNRTET